MELTQTYQHKSDRTRFSMLKELLKFKDGTPLDIKYPIEIKDSRGNVVYYESIKGFWAKHKYNALNQQVYSEYSDGDCATHEYDARGNVIYTHSSLYGIVEDKRPKVEELTISQIEKLLNKKIKVVGE